MDDLDKLIKSLSADERQAVTKRMGELAMTHDLKEPRTSSYAADGKVDLFSITERSRQGSK